MNPKLTFLSAVATIPVKCSLCGSLREDLVAKLPIDMAGGWRRIITAAVSDGQPWIGLCETCVRYILAGFEVARRAEAGHPSAGGSEEPGGDR
jgi:hypothetical protein